ncbi:MAG TPA: STAS domain-containing protein [Gaiella sp.]|jgi:anti-anti-sigma regulatory factor|nr:STAS domain-containing protein [Gaiella sp.]
MPETELPTSVSTIALGRRVRVIVLRGRICAGAEDELREQLIAALEEGAQGVLLDLTRADSISVSAHEVVRAASLTLDDRGGVLLAWRWNGSIEEPTYVLAELRDHDVSELVPVEDEDGEAS